MTARSTNVFNVVPAFLFLVLSVVQAALPSDVIAARPLPQPPHKDAPAKVALRGTAPAVAVGRAGVRRYVPLADDFSPPSAAEEVQGPEMPAPTIAPISPKRAKRPRWRHGGSFTPPTPATVTHPPPTPPIAEDEETGVDAEVVHRVSSEDNAKEIGESAAVTATAAPRDMEGKFAGNEWDTMTTPPPQTTTYVKQRLQLQYFIRSGGSSAASTVSGGTALTMKQFFGMWFIYLTIVAAFGCLFYHRGHVSHDSSNHAPDPEHTMAHGHFDCVSDPEIALYSCCCPWLRWADTMSMAKMLTFWWAFALIAGFSFLTYISAIASAGLLFHHRRHLRTRLKITHGTGREKWKVFCMDIWYACCCPWCLIAQEARVVKEAHLLGKLPEEAPVANKMKA